MQKVNLYHGFHQIVTVKPINYFQKYKRYLHKLKKIFKLHSQATHEGRRLQCSKCEYDATGKSQIENHKKSVHMGQIFQYPECDHQATLKGSLVTHQNPVHMGQEYQCPECDYQGTNNKYISEPNI